MAAGAVLRVLSSHLRVDAIPARTAAAVDTAIGIGVGLGIGIGISIPGAPS
jgi:hypothetical protein